MGYNSFSVIIGATHLFEVNEYLVLEKKLCLFHAHIIFASSVRNAWPVNNSTSFF